MTDEIGSALSKLGLGAEGLVQHELVHPSQALQQVRDLGAREESFSIGLPSVNACLLPFGPGEFVMVQGYAHSGKTYLMLSAVAQQLNRRVLWITPDEPASLVHRRLISILTGMGTHELWAGLQEGNQAICAAADAWTEVIGKAFLMVDEPVGISELNALVDQATNFWQAPPDVLVFDYLECLPHHPDRSGTLAMSFKMWAKPKPFPTVVLHQASRQHGAKGQRMEMWSGNQGGERESLVLIGVSRPGEEPDSDVGPDVVEVNIIKNKHTGQKVTAYCHQDPITGKITEE